MPETNILLFIISFRFLRFLYPAIQYHVVVDDRAAFQFCYPPRLVVAQCAKLAVSVVYYSPDNTPVTTAWCISFMLLYTVE